MNVQPMNHSVEIQVLLFAGVRDAAGCDRVTVSVSDRSDASEILDALAEQLPTVAGLIRVSRLAIGGRYVGGDHRIESFDDEFALIPPVSGG